MEAIDVVITYVNGLDSVWQEQYVATTNKPVLEKRYRDWGFLPYQLRGIATFMPFVRNVYLVVSTASQVPAWIDTDNVHVVLHEDIIPAAYLPTFNSGTIELYLHRIEGLSNQYIYFNDDIFPLDNLTPDIFFKDNKVCTHIARHWLACNNYKKRVRVQDRLAQYVAYKSGKQVQSSTCSFIRPQHTCTPMLRDANREALSIGDEKITSSISSLRTTTNPNQYFYTDYLYYTGQVVNCRIPTKHCSMAIYSAGTIARHILHPLRSLVCINDVSMSDSKQALMQATLLAAFQQRLPEKSRFEK